MPASRGAFALLHFFLLPTTPLKLALFPPVSSQRRYPFWCCWTPLSTAQATSLIRVFFLFYFCSSFPPSFFFLPVLPKQTLISILSPSNLHSLPFLSIHIPCRFPSLLYQRTRTPPNHPFVLSCAALLPLCSGEVLVLRVYVDGEGGEGGIGSSRLVGGGRRSV